MSWVCNQLLVISVSNKMIIDSKNISSNFMSLVSDAVKNQDVDINISNDDVITNQDSSRSPLFEIA